MQGPENSRDGLQRVHGAATFIWRIVVCVHFPGTKVLNELQIPSGIMTPACLPPDRAKPLMDSESTSRWLGNKGSGWCGTLPGNFFPSIRVSPTEPRDSEEALRRHRGDITATGDRLYTIGLPPEISFKECFPLLWKKEGGG